MSRASNSLSLICSVAAFAMCLCTPAFANDQLGGYRLFLSSEQRAQLDRKRDGVEEVVVPVVVEAPKPKPKIEPKPKPKPELPSVSLQGYVVRGDGENTVWLNNRPVEEGQRAARDVRVLSIDESSGDAEVNLANEKTIRIKPGEKFEPKAEQVIDPVN
ncbi:MAG: hypothetical protein AAF434_02250 [Pseudomonadota bacterium]